MQTQNKNVIAHHIFLQTDLNWGIKICCFLLVIFQILLESSYLFSFVFDGLIEGLEFLVNPLVSLSCWCKLVSSSLFGIKLLPSLFSLCQSSNNTYLEQILITTYNVSVWLQQHEKNYYNKLKILFLGIGTKN